MIVKQLENFITINDIKIEDGGHAQILTIIDHEDQIHDLDDGVFVKIHSWIENGHTHPEMNILKNKRVRVTIEIID